MASSSSDATSGFSLSDGAPSLFEGMVLIDPISSDPIQAELDEPEPPPQLPSPSHSSSSVATSQSQPLDEDLFSDLTLLSPTPVSPAREETIGLAAEISRRSPAPSRQISRKKKRGVKVGYAREAAPGNNSVKMTTTTAKVVGREPNIVSPLSAQDTGLAELKRVVLEIEDDKHCLQSPPMVDRGDSVIKVDGGVDGKTKDKSVTGESVAEEEVSAVKEENMELASPEATEKEDAFALAERKLESIRAQISQRLKRIQGMASSTSVERKESVERRRKAAEEANAASVRHKELERELEEACETEDFERAEMVSERLASVEKEKKELLGALKKAEAECVSVDSRMHVVLETKIEAEEEASRLLEQFAQESGDNADLVMKNAEDIFLKEIEEWEMSSEALEISKLEMDVEILLIDEARSGLQNSIEQSIQDDMKEKERLSIKQDVLAKELDELLSLVRLKKAEIEENNCQLQEVEKRISNVEDAFQNSQSIIDKKRNDLQSALLKVESDGVTLSLGKKKISEHFTSAEMTKSKLRELACVSDMEARTCNESVLLRKRLSSPILKSREEKIQLTRMVEGITEDIQMLGQQILAARSSLQELSSNRSSIQEEIAARRQRISFIDKRGPELEAEKKVAAAARNFKEAGRITTEAKALSTEKENIQNKMTKAVSDVDDIEGKINSTLNDIEEKEGLISTKEKEVAKARFERLRLDAAAARAERFAAITLGDTEESDTLLEEAEAAESKAAELQQAYDIGIKDLDSAFKDHISIALVINLEGERLVEVASSLTPATVDGS